MAEWLFPDLTTVLFDVDGTLCSSASLHHRAWSQSLRELGMSGPSWATFVSECLRRQRRLEDLLPQQVLDRYGRQKLYSAKNQIFQRLAGESLRPLPGVVDFWARIQSLGLGLGVVSTARRPSVETTLRLLRLPWPDAIISREDVEPRTKPDPLGYELAAQRLGATPHQCLAFEDAPAGIRAARSANIFCTAIASEIFPPDEQHRANLRIGSLAELVLERRDDGVRLRVATTRDRPPSS